MKKEVFEVMCNLAWMIAVALFWYRAFHFGTKTRTFDLWFWGLSFVWASVTLSIAAGYFEK